MLEIKNGRIDRDGSPLFSHLSLIAKEGEVVCVAGSHGSGKSRLLQAFLGFFPLDEGYMNIDGDLIDVKSAPFFRQKMAYLPQEVDFPYEKVSDMLNVLFSLKRESTPKETESVLMSLWEEMNIPAEVFERKLSEMDISERRLVLLSGICALQRPIVLLDEPCKWFSEEQLVKAGVCIRWAARNGSAVIVTCQEHDPVLRYCEKLVEINSHSYHNEV